MARAAVNIIGGQVKQDALNSHIRKVYNNIQVRTSGGVTAAVGTLTATLDATAYGNILLKVTVVGENTSQVLGVDFPYGEYVARLYQNVGGGWVLGEFLKVYEDGNWTLTAVTGTLTASTIQILLTGPTGTSENATVIVEAIGVSHSAVNFVTFSLS